MLSFSGTDRFEVQEHLGSGAFGDVYRVYDRRLETVVALKTLQRADPGALYRFKQEFRALAGLAHPNLVHLYELLATDESWFFTMELVDGDDFLAFVRRATSADDAGADDETLTLSASARPFECLRDALRQLAVGLAALHAAGRLHCDVKPSNVLVDRRGRVVLLDFGLARELSPDATFQTRIGEIAGTPAYMSPEQVDATRVTAASDWYAVGVMLFEALTGRRPFNGRTLEVLAAKQTREAPSPRTLCPGLPEDLNRLCEELLARDAGRRPDGEEVLARLGEAPANEDVPVAEEGPCFVGRAAALEELRETFELACHGRAMAVFVRGASGIGKTTLVRHFVDGLRRARPAPLVLAGRCHERESVPYKGLDALIDLVSRFLKQLPDDEARRLLPPRIGALARLFPVLRRVPAVERASLPAIIAAGEELRKEARRTLRGLLGRLAQRQPLVLVIDDLQWGDHDSADLLGAALDPPDPPPLLLVACHRGGEGPALSLRARLAASTLPLTGLEVRELDVAELPLAESRELALTLLDPPDEALAERIARESAGSPFFVVELARAARAGRAGRTQGASLERLITERARRLPPEARRLLRVVAVAARPVALRVAARAAGIEGEAQAAIQALRSERLVRIGDDHDHPLETYHDRIRDVLVQKLDTEALKDCYARLARALEDSGDADPETLALCFEKMGDRERAAELAVVAANRARDVLAFGRAARLYGLAIDLAGDGRAAPELHAHRGHALAGTGRFGEAASAYLVAADLTEGSESVWYRLGAFWQLFLGGEWDRSVETMRRALASLDLELPESSIGALLPTLLRRLYLGLRGPRFRERRVGDLSREQLLRIDACLSAAVLGHVRLFLDRYFTTRALVLGLAAGEPYRLAMSFALEASSSAMLHGRRREDRTARWIQISMRLAKRTGHPYAIGTSTLHAGIAAFLELRPKRAQELCERAEELFRERRSVLGAGLPDDTDHPGAIHFSCNLAKFFQLLVLLLQGRLREITRRLPEILDDMRGNAVFEAMVRSRVTWFVQLAADRPGEARREVERAHELWPAPGIHTLGMSQLVGEVEIALYEGEPQAALRLLEDSWPELRRSGLLHAFVFRGIAHHLRARALLATALALGDGDDRVPGLLRRMRRDLRALETGRSGSELSNGHLLRAGAATLRGDAAEALERLVDAETAFEAEHVELHAAVCRLRRGQLLGAAGTELVAEATRWMEGEGIANIERMAGVVAPGVWRT